MNKKVRKVVVDEKKCVGAVTCTVVAPQAFRMNSSGIAEVLPGAENLDDNLLIMAAQSCPFLAIELYDENNNLIFPFKTKI